MLEALGTVYGLLFVLFLVAMIFFWPVLYGYILWRALHDLRRIANALEHTAGYGGERTPQPRPQIAPVPTRGDSGVSNSAFGR